MPISVAHGAGVAFSAVAGATGPPKVLPVRYQSQSQTNWCWAACFSMIRELLGAPAAQCELASAVLGGDCCGAPHTCNQPAAPEGAGEPCRLDFFPREPLKFEAIRSQIDAGLPVEAYFQWDIAGEAHVMLIVGYREGGMLEVLDPWSSSGHTGTHSYDEVVRAFGHGGWTKAYDSFTLLP